MKGPVEFGAALLIATGLHVAAISGFDSGSAPSGGEGGESTLTIAAASPDLVARVQEWDTSPAIGKDAKAMVVEAPQETASAPAEESRVARLEIAEMLQVDAPLPSVPLASASGMDQPSFSLAVPAPPSVSKEAKPTRRQQMVVAAPEMDSAPKAAPGPEKPVRAPEQTPRPQTRPSREIRDRQVATGTGRATTSGQASAPSPAKATAVSAASLRAAQRAWASAIQSRIARRQVFPRGVRESGRVTVVMDILSNGRLRSVRVAKSSGVQQFDAAALNAVRRAAPFPPAPEAMTDPFYTVTQRLNFERRR